jgi:FtsX-like permease family protein
MRKDRNDRNPRSSLLVLAELLLKGQQVDWRYSLVVILVITGMFSTPLALGSIRNRAYAAVKAQIEKENNAREVSLQQARDDAPPLDRARLAEITHRFPGAETVGNYKLVVSVEGPQGSDLPTLQTLVPGDPRTAPLAIVPGVPATFGLTDLVVSDALGRLLYGEGWNKLWDGSGNFKGPKLRLRINDLPIQPELRVVARRTLPGRGLYGSDALGSALRHFSWGFGAPELGLPADQGLVQASLPHLATPRCVVALDDGDPSCDRDGRDRLMKRLTDLHYRVDRVLSGFPALTDHQSFGIGLAEVFDEGGKTQVREARAECKDALSHHLVSNCSGALVAPDLRLRVGFEQPSGMELPATVVAATAEMRALLPGAKELAERKGSAAPATDGAFDLAVPAATGLPVGAKVRLRVKDTRVPARVQSLYQCAGGLKSCPVFADPLAVFRLTNLAEGSVRLQSAAPVVFVPTATGESYDEILVYPESIERVEPASTALRSLYPGYNVQYNVAALDKLRRQDTRLATLFSLTIALSALFLILALGALARINIERRSRQMAQMLILGFSRRFVRRLVVAEYLLLTAAASLAAVVLTNLLCFAARMLLSSPAGDSGGSDFAVIVQSMAVDPRAFVRVFAVVAICTWLIAVVSAHRAAKADPLTLLD